MPWEYLQHPDFAGRLKPLAAAIGEWADGARVIDINCGTAPMAALLEGYADYLGNDLSAKFIAAAREALESKTATATFHRLLCHEPAVVGIESVRLWEERYGAVAALESALQAANYDRIDGGNVDLPGKTVLVAADVETLRKMIALLRVKNEARWIERVIRSVVPVCERVLVLDDHSTDRTAEIAYNAGAMVFPNPHEGLNETRDKNHLLSIAATYAQPNEWALMIDGDEELHANDVSLLRSECNTGEEALSMRVLYLWDDPQHVRMDGVYARFRRPSAFRMAPGIQFRTTPNGGNFHCGNVPVQYVHRAKLTDIRLLHYGYLDRADRLRKYEWYNAQDPGNTGEDCYRHMVVGDVFPADSAFRYGGPLRLEAL